MAPSPRTFFIGGNFKSNGTVEGIKTIVNRLKNADLVNHAEVVISPPALHLLLAKDALGEGSKIKVAAQNIFDKGNGAYTGEISAEQLKDAGIEWVILGHSERRTIFKESDEFIASKTKAALDQGLSVILCCGETLEEHDANVTEEVVIRQLKAVADVVKDWSKIVIAYEPVWAIGTGKKPKAPKVQELHAYIRNWLKETVDKDAADKIRILYGGSAKEDADTEEMAQQPDVDGFLVGGASLTEAFIPIINYARYK